MLTITFGIHCKLAIVPTFPTLFQHIPTFPYSTGNLQIRSFLFYPRLNKNAQKVGDASEVSSARGLSIGIGHAICPALDPSL